MYVMAQSTASVTLHWSDEDQSGFVASIDLVPSDGRLITHEPVHGRGSDPVPALAEALDRICRQVDIHPNNVAVTITVDGADLMTAAMRGKIGWY